MARRGRPRLAAAAEGGRVKKPLFHCLGCDTPIHEGDEAAVVSTEDAGVKIEYAMCPPGMGRVLSDAAFETELNQRAENLPGRITA